MPFPNMATLTVDTFFQDNNYANYLTWMQNIRTALLALNQYNPQSSFFATVANDPDILVYIAEVLSITTAVQLYGQEQMAQQNSYISNAQTAAASSILADNVIRNNKILTEIKNRDKSSSTANDPVPQNLRMNSDPSSFGYTKSYQTTDANGAPVVNVPAFPKVGQEYDNHMSDITSRLTSLDTFEVFTGYRPKDNSANDPQYDFKSWAVVKGPSPANWDSDPSRTFTPDRTYTAYINDIIKKTNATPYPGAYKFFIEKLHGRYSDGTPYKMNGLKSQTFPTGETNLTNRMVFYAYLENYADNYNVSWTDYNFIGRAEQVPAYKSTKRDITLEFILLTDYNIELMVAMEQLNNVVNNSTDDDILTNLIKAQNIDWGLGLLTPPAFNLNGKQVGNVAGVYSDTPEGLWQKMTFLSQCVYPYYRDDGKMKDQPIVRMRIADFYDVIVYIGSLQMSMNAFDGPMVDMNPSSIGNMPFGVKVTMNGTILHNYEPSSTFYGFYNRREFDTGALDPSTGVGINLHLNKIQLGATKNSPTQFFNTAVNEKTLDTSKVDVGALQKSLNNFSTSFSALQNTGSTLLTSYMKQQTKASIEAFKAVSEVASYLQIVAGVSSTSITSTSSLQSANSPQKSPNANSTLSGTTGGDFQTAQQANDLFLSIFNTTNVQTPAQLTAVPSVNTNNTIPPTNSDSQKIGGNLMTQSESDALTAASKAVNTGQPKTLQDIIDFAKAKNS